MNKNSVMNLRINDNFIRINKRLSQVLFIMERLWEYVVEVLSTGLTTCVENLTQGPEKATRLSSKLWIRTLTQIFHLGCRAHFE